VRCAGEGRPQRKTESEDHVSDSNKGESFADLFAQEGSRAPRRGSLRLGERVDATVIKVGKDAVFVELDGKQEAFIERFDLCDREGKLTVDVGARISAKVAEIGGKAGGVRLAPLVIRSSNDENATATAAPTLNEPVLAAGLRVKGTVSRVERYGVFVQIAGSQGRKGRGLIPTQETGTPRGADLHKAFPVGSEVEAKILAIDEEGKIRLSISALAVDEERSLYENFAKDKEKPAEGDKPKQNPRSLGTFGDLLAKKGIGKK
jgi:small subunit ribosomal protein S1